MDYDHESPYEQLKANRRKINIGLWGGGYSGFYDRTKLPVCPGCIPSTKLEPEKSPDGKDGWRCFQCGTFSVIEETIPITPKDKRLKPKDITNSQSVIISQLPASKRKRKNNLGDVDNQDTREELKSYGIEAADPKDYFI